MARSFAPSLLVLATLIALVFPQLGLFAATLTHSEGQENVDTSLSTPTLTHEYDVFVSFRGEDTRTNFKAYLLAAFDRKRIRAYRDDKDLPRGREIGPELLKAIETSRIAVVVFSKNYATSSWCLDELVKIMECKRLLNQSVMPIFYEVSQSVVLEQKEIFAEALLNGPIDKVNNWRTALKEAANLEGFHLEPDRCGELADHFLLHSLVAYELWSLVFCLIGIHWIMPHRVIELFDFCSRLSLVLIAI
ncbi:TMV resistance protein N-like isoform X2 [Quercus lobata]|uniref:TMV resistance protein N-like isoform X2 n=1 Tax=Quercus lobata TaxID=97700 RepID=UPI001248AAF7|nr:TMV resistance protein N-like isoform X2 [Quercus lobata]